VVTPETGVSEVIVETGEGSEADASVESDRQD